MTKLGFAVVNIPNTGMCLNQLRQVTDVPYEPKRKLLSGPGATPLFDLQLFVEIVQLLR